MRLAASFFVTFWLRVGVGVRGGRPLGRQGGAAAAGVPGLCLQH